jgi:hypothetical protein
MMEDWAEWKPSIVFGCNSLQQTYEEISERGVEFTREPKDMPWGPFTKFLGVDGNWYGLREAGHRLVEIVLRSPSSSLVLISIWATAPIGVVL